MIELGIDRSGAVAVGNDAGWAVTVHRESGTAELDEQLLHVSSATHNGTVKAGLRGGLEAGEFEIVVAGLMDEEHRAFVAPSGAHPRVVCLYLFWRDTNATVAGYLAQVSTLSDVLGAFAAPPKDALVAVLSVTKASRRRGKQRYETVITAHERVWERLKTVPFSPIEADTVTKAAQELADRAGIKLELEDPKVSPRRPTPQVGTASDVAMRKLAAQLEEATGFYGRRQLLIRNGVLHFGPREIPVATPKALDVERGLLEVRAGKVLRSLRRRYTVTLKGRPDLRPGDVVSFEEPPEEVTDPGPGPRLGFSGALATEALTVRDVLFGASATTATGEQVVLYVAGVRHQLDRENGFKTVATGVTLELGLSPWDERAFPDPDIDPAGDAIAGAVEGVRSITRDAMRSAAGVDVGEVRAFASSGGDEPPSQTTTLWRGLVSNDGGPHGTRRLDVHREDPDVVEGTPYVTPFAWGPYGLVLPRYPGTRVALLHRQGRPEDPIDIGAVWRSGKGPGSHPGDWWLILPVGISEEDRETTSADAPEAPRGAATHDLIDADGNRIIEVGELTVRVGRNKLTETGNRPGRAETADSITIEHATHGSTIVMTADGDIVIDAKAGLTLKAATDITMQADNVIVEVGTAMEVS